MIPGRNEFERSISRQLRRAKVKFEYEKHKLKYIIEGKYIPDWVLENGIIIEGKGFLRPEDKRKLLAVKRNNREADIRFVFYRSVPSQIRWATRNGFPYAIGRIPDEWLHSSSMILPKSESIKENGIGVLHAMEKFKIGGGLVPSTISLTNG